MLVGDGCEMCYAGEAFASERRRAAAMVGEVTPGRKEPDTMYEPPLGAPLSEARTSPVTRNGPRGQEGVCGHLQDSNMA